MQLPNEHSDQRIFQQSNLIMRALVNAEPDRTAIGAVLAASDDYSWLITGESGKLGDADSTFADGPPDWRSEDKFVTGFFVNEKMIGFADIYRHWNAPHKAHIGFLIFAPTARGAGYGSSAVMQIEALAASWAGINTLRIGVIANNQRGLRFWRKMGFAETGEIKKDVAPYIADILVLEKPFLSS